MRAISEARASSCAFLLALLFTLAAMRSACSSCPSTHMLLPSPRTTVAMQRLASQTGAIAVVITTQGDEQALTVRPSQLGLLSGDSLAPDAAPPGDAPAPLAALPFDSLALIYYIDPGRKTGFPQKSAFPEPPAVGDAERALSCVALDTELSRAETLRWLAREQGASPYTEAEKRHLHVTHAAKNTAIGGLAVLLAPWVVGYGLIGAPVAGANAAFGHREESCPTTRSWYPDPEGYRWAISAIDARVEGLLRLKQQKQCAARTALQADTTDLMLLDRFDAWKAQQPSIQDEHLMLAKRTEAFDELGPKAVVDQPQARKQAEQAARVDAAQQLLPADEHVDQVLSDALWLGETKGGWTRLNMMDNGKVPRGDIVLTDRSFLFVNSAKPTVHIPYAQVETVGVARFGFLKWVRVRTKDGHEQFFSMGNTVDEIKLTQAAADLLRAKVRSGAAGPVENQPEPR